MIKRNELYVGSMNFDLIVPDIRLISLVRITYIPLETMLCFYLYWIERTPRGSMRFNWNCLAFVTKEKNQIVHQCLHLTKTKALDNVKFRLWRAFVFVCLRQTDKPYIEHWSEDCIYFTLWISRLAMTKLWPVITERLNYFTYRKPWFDSTSIFVQ